MAPRSAEERAHALDLLRQEHTPAEVAEVTGIPRRTIAQWATNAGIPTSPQAAAKTEKARLALELKWAERREALADRIGAGTELALDQAIAFLRAGRPRDAKDAATTLGILVDKAQLLTGAATSRSDHLGLQAQVLEQARTQAPHLRAVG